MFKADFDLDPALIYLNSANLSICPSVINRAVERYRVEFEKNPTQGLSDAWGKLWRVQKRLATFLNAEAEDLFLRGNVTSVLNTFILGTDLDAGSEILVGELEYGAIVNVCRLRARRDQLSWRILEMPHSVAAVARLTKEKLLDHIISQMGPRTRMVLLSHVLGGTGLVLPIEEIAAYTRSKNIRLVVDGAYAPGAIPINFANFSNVDFYGCSLYKWMLGPKGTAFGWIAKTQRERLQPINAGWTTFEDFAPFAEFGEGDRFQATFVMAGCHDFAPYYAIGDLMDYWEQRTAVKIQDEMKTVREAWIKNLERLGWRAMQSQDSRLNGPLVAFLLPARFQSLGAAFTKVVRAQCGIQINTVCLKGLWHAVISPHVYNSVTETEAAAYRLSQALLQSNNHFVRKSLFLPGNELI
jgi:isopenicillin-N epimerase